MTRLLAIPADPLSAYVRKGEVKERYFNPEDLFDEIEYLTLDEGAVDDGALRTWSGRARYRVHALGRLRVLSLTRDPYVGPLIARAVAAARACAPDVVRCYDPVETGWWARAAARVTRVPYVVSLHGNYDLDIRERLRAKGHWKGWLYYQITRRLVEPAVLKDAAQVVCAYEFAARYARAMGVSAPEVIYNRVDLTRFRPAPREGAFRVLFVGRCQENKGQELLIRAMREVDGELVLVGDGPTRPALERLAADLGLSARVAIVPAVPHREIAATYARATCFASAILYGGIQIPHLEAMASGLPLAVTKPLWEDAPEQMGDVALVVERDPAQLAAALRRIASDRPLADDLAARSLRRARELSGDQMEHREREMYERVLAAAAARAA